MPEVLLPVPGLAKAAPVPIVAPVEGRQAVEIAPAVSSQGILSSPHWEGVPTDVIRYFVGDNFGAMSPKTVELLRDINNWSKQDLAEDTIGNRMQKIKSLDVRIGAPGIHESRIDKIWNWCRMDSHINELRKRQSAFER